MFLPIEYELQTQVPQSSTPPPKVPMPSSFSSQRLVFLAETLRPKVFVPCILAMWVDCILGQSVCVALKALLDQHYTTWPLLRAFLKGEKKNLMWPVRHRFDRNFNGNELPMAFYLNRSDAQKYKMFSNVRPVVGPQLCLAGRALSSARSLP